MSAELILASIRAARSVSPVPTEALNADSSKGMASSYRPASVAAMPARSSSAARSPGSFVMAIASRR
jgi:hypothetical protein